MSKIELYDPQLMDDRRKMFYVHSAYRNEPDFSSDSVHRMGAPFEAPSVWKLIENVVRAQDNYQRVVSNTIEGL